MFLCLGYPELHIGSMNPAKVKLIEINPPKDKFQLNYKYIDNDINIAEHMRVYKVKYGFFYTIF